MLPRFAAAFFLSLVIALLGACDNRQANLYRSQLDSVKRDYDAEKDKTTDLEKQSQRLEHEMGSLKAQVEEAKKDREKLEEALKKLDKEFSDYREKYKVSIAKQVPGYPLGEFVVNKRTYLDTHIKSINDDSIVLSHPDGLVRVMRSDMTPDLLMRLAMDDRTAGQRQAETVLKLVADHKNGRTQSAGPTFAGDGNSIAALGTYAQSLRSVAVVKVTISQGTGYGSGFVANCKGRKYFYTNCHVMGGEKPKATIVNGPGNFADIAMPREVEVSDDEEEGDILRFELTDSDIPALEILENSDKLLPGQKIVALGNSGGQGVIPVLKGKTAGIGRYVVEVDAPFVHGNSGGPVIWENTNIVIGIATRHTDRSGGDTLLGFQALPGSVSSGVRRLCVRPEKIEKWKRVSLDRIYRESQVVEQIYKDNQILKDLMNFHLNASGKYLYSIQYSQPVNYLFSTSKMAGSLVQEIKNLESNLALIKRELEAITNPKNGVPPAQEQSERAQKQAQLRARHVFGDFVAAVDRFYGADVIGSSPQGYCVFNRKMFEEVAKDRLDVIDNINKHFAEEIRRFNLDSQG